jgi:hypothetical protein
MEFSSDNSRLSLCYHISIKYWTRRLRKSQLTLKTTPTVHCFTIMVITGGIAKVDNKATGLGK